MKRCIQLMAAFSAVLMSLAGTAHVMAAPVGSHSPAITGRQSDSNLRWARRRVEENIDMLQHDRSDYGGYRVKALALFQQAREQLTLGLKFDNGREDVAPPAGFLRPDAQMVYLRGQCASDVNLNVVRRNIEHIMDVLQRDKGDYGGHRVAALRQLAAGREMLKDAINYDNTH
jgi:hypothetical protein